MFLNKEGSRDFGESSVSPTCIQHRFPPPTDPRGRRLPGYLWPWSVRAFVSPSASGPTDFPELPSSLLSQGRLRFPAKRQLPGALTQRASPGPCRGRPTLWPAGVPELPRECRLQDGLRLCQIRARVLRPQSKAARGKKQAPWLDLGALSPLGLSPFPVQPL